MGASVKSLRLSDEFGISCGTVTVDLRQHKVLLIRFRATNELFLPKGRKNIGETLEKAAVRETYEETGFRVALMPLAIPTLATLAYEAPPPNGNESAMVTEPIAMTQRVVKDRLKVIFWYAAEGDSSATPDSGTQQEGEDYESGWEHFSRAVDMLTFDEDRTIVRAVIDAALLRQVTRRVE